MKRRAFLGVLGGAAAGWPIVTHAHQSDRVRRIGVLSGYAENDTEARARLAGFQQGLHELGWIVGRNLRTEYRWSRGDGITQERSQKNWFNCSQKSSWVRPRRWQAP